MCLAGKALNSMEQTLRPEGGLTAYRLDLAQALRLNRRLRLFCLAGIGRKGAALLGVA